MGQPIHRRGGRRRAAGALAALACLVAGAAGCLEGGDGAVLSACFDDAECATGFCYAATCLEADGDPDGDGITSAAERLLGLHPLDADSDDDGRDDGTEVGASDRPADSDGDGVIDALEALTADRDGDCVPDPFDAVDTDPGRPDVTVLRSLFCRSAGVCADHGGARRVFCENGLPRCDYRDVPGFEYQETSCDGRDNDCDGRTDEELRVDGQPVGAACGARGACGAGLVECDPVRRVPVCSTHPGGSASQAQPERCNGIDDDCDGRTDEDVATPGGALLGAACNGVGACGPGVAECAPDADRAICSTEPGGSEDEATAELCDALDNDCDGETDEELVTPGAGCALLGVCADAEDRVTRRCAMGRWRCDYAGVAGWEAGEELSCDGRDNDCDGETDEAFAHVDFDGLPRRVGSACGTGACAGGVVACRPDGAGATCSSLGSRSPEDCDGVDDDCDGLTDEEQLYEGKAPGQLCSGRGECGVGVVECSPTAAATCSTNPDGSAPGVALETCNGRDDDCDGRTDEEQTAPDDLCDAPGVCAGVSVTATCDAGEWVCDRDAIPGYEVGTERTCDGLDNDCDGLVDEPFGKRFGDRFVTVDGGEPAVRSGAAVARDPAGQRAWLFGGRSGAGVHDDLWTRSLSDGAWAQVRPASADAPWPPPLTGATLLADPVSGELLLVGGDRGAVGRAPTWNGAVWRFRPDAGWVEIAAADAPDVTRGAMAAWDPVSRRVWLHASDPDGGGLVARLEPDDPAPRWRTYAPDGLPAGRNASVRFDAPNGRLVIFGGRVADDAVLADTVIVDVAAPDTLGVTWWALAPEGGPPGRAAHAAAIDDARRRLLVYGGENGDGTLRDDLWAFDLDSEEWSAVTADGAHPPPLSDAGLVVDGDGAWLVGGWRDGGRADRALRRLDLAAGTWEESARPTGPPPLADAATALDAAGRRWFVVGGRTPTLAGEALVAGLWVRDLETGTWERPSETVGLVAGGRADAVALWDADRRRLLVHGGHVEDEEGATVPSAALWGWDVDAGVWTRPSVEGTPPPAVADHAGVTVPGAASALLFGGVTAEGPTAALWQLDLDRLAWSSVPPGSSAPPALRGHAALWHAAAGHMYVLGGSGGGGQVLRFDPTTAAWSVLATIPALAGTRPAVWLDPLSDTVLAGAWRAAATAPVFVRLEGGAAAPHDLLPPLPSGVGGAAYAHDPADRRAWLFGGRGRSGHITGALRALDEVCP